MSRPQKKMDSEIVRLEQKHVQLAERVADIDRRPHLSSMDQTELSQLKREKLAMKDALTLLRRDP